MRILVVNFISLCYITFFGCEAKYTNQWAVDIHGGPEEADLVAQETGCINEGRQKSEPEVTKVTNRQIVKN